jgi:hypothetical protein
MRVTGDIVAEHHREIGAECVRMFDNLLDVFQRHPGIAGVKIGDDGDLELEIVRPLRR